MLPTQESIPLRSNKEKINECSIHIINILKEMILFHRQLVRMAEIVYNKNI
jgi:hypothetical protein